MNRQEIWNMKLKGMANKRKERVRAMRAKGMRWKDIGLKLGVSTQRAQQLGRDE